MAVEITEENVRVMAKAIDLDIPEADLKNVALRLSSFLDTIAEIERDLGDQMDKVDPIPPVYPREEF